MGYTVSGKHYFFFSPRFVSDWEGGGPHRREWKYGRAKGYVVENPHYIRACLGATVPFRSSRCGRRDLEFYLRYLMRGSNEGFVRSISAWL